ncbi:MAG TPA: helix-turn-helix domain-containing protein, partial [Erysipelothrix sp.]
MIELVEVSHYRLLNILDFLLNQQTSITAKEAAKLNNTSLITSQRDLKNFYDQFNTTIDLSYAKNQLKIERSCISKSCIVSRKIFSESISLQLFSSILYNPYKSRRFHCDHLSISDATFYRFVDNLNQNLESQKIMITSHKGDYFVKAENEH